MSVIVQIASRDRPEHIFGRRRDGGGTEKNLVDRIERRRADVAVNDAERADGEGREPAARGMRRNSVAESALRCMNSKIFSLNRHHFEWPDGMIVSLPTKNDVCIMLKMIGQPADSSMRARGILGWSMKP
jgi:hypothetical protein